MKRYRITKKYVDFYGNEFNPQGLEEADGFYIAYSTENIKTLLYAEKVIRLGADWLEEIPEESEKIEELDMDRISDNVGFITSVELTAEKVNELVAQVNKLTEEIKLMKEEK